MSVLARVQVRQMLSSSSNLIHIPHLLYRCHPRRVLHLRCQHPHRYPFSHLNTPKFPPPHSNSAPRERELSAVLTHPSHVSQTAQTRRRKLSRRTDHGSSPHTSPPSPAFIDVRAGGRMDSPFRRIAEVGLAIP
jgi:hypothetical protein